LAVRVDEREREEEKEEEEEKAEISTWDGLSAF
jgi:hypothetical protein